METIFIKFEQDSGVTIQAYPFREDELFKFFDLDSSITIKDAYIRIYGTDDDTIDDNFITWLTGKNLFKFKTLRQLLELCNLPLERDVNKLDIIFSEHNCSTFVDDEGSTTFYIQKNYKDMLKKICKFLFPADYEHLYSLVITNEKKYVCVKPETKQYKIYDNPIDMQKEEYL